MFRLVRFSSRVFIALVLVFPMVFGAIPHMVQADAVICPANNLVNGFCIDGDGIVKFEFTEKNYYQPGTPTGRLNYIAADGLTVDVTRKHAANIESLDVMNLTAFSEAPINRDPNDFWGGCSIASASEGDTDGKTISLSCAEPVNGAGDDIYFVFTDKTSFVEYFYHVTIADNAHSFSAFEVNGQNRRSDAVLTINNDDEVFIRYETESPTFSTFSTARSVSMTSGISINKKDSTIAEFGCSNGAATKDDGDVIPVGNDLCFTSSPSGRETMGYCIDPDGITGVVAWNYGIGALAGDDAEHQVTIQFVDNGGENAEGCGVAAPTCVDNSVNQGFEVCDGTASSPGFTCNTACTNHLPIAQSQEMTIASDSNDPVQITLTSIDPDSQTHVFTTDATGTDGTVGPDAEGNESSGTRTSVLTYTPPGDFEVGDSTSFTFSVNDGIDDSGTATVTIVKAQEGGTGRRRIIEKSCPNFTPPTTLRASAPAGTRSAASGAEQDAFASLAEQVFSTSPFSSAVEAMMRQLTR